MFPLPQGAGGKPDRETDWEQKCTGLRKAFSFQLSEFRDFTALHYKSGKFI